MREIVEQNTGCIQDKANKIVVLAIVIEPVSTTDNKCNKNKLPALK